MISKGLFKIFCDIRKKMPILPGGRATDRGTNELVLVTDEVEGTELLPLCEAKFQ